MNDLMTDSD